MVLVTFYLLYGRLTELSAACIPSLATPPAIVVNSSHDVSSAGVHHVPFVKRRVPCSPTMCSMGCGTARPHL